MINQFNKIYDIPKIYINFINMIYNFLTDFCNMKTTVYLYSEYTDKNGKFQQKPLSKALSDDVPLKDIVAGAFKLNWLFKDCEYGKSIQEITLKARTYAHGSTEYNDIKMRLPGYTWNGTVQKEDVCNEETQEIYEKRKRRSKETIDLNGLVCVEFDDIDPKEVPDYIEKALTKFPHIIYAGRTLSNGLFCMHRADKNINNQNFILYFMELAVQYYNELGITADTSCCDQSRIRYMCSQIGARTNMTYCDFKPSENIDIEYNKIFNKKANNYITRVQKYKPKNDETIYDYDENKGFYYGHTKQHLHRMGELIVPVPSIEQIINTLISIGKTKEEIISLWKNTLKYYNYRTSSRNVDDQIRLTEKMINDNREFIKGETTYTFLLMFFPNIVGSTAIYLDKEEFLCDRYYDMLLNSIMVHNRILIHGDTGIGKTYFANKLSNDKDVIVIVPYNAHLDNYPMYDRNYNDNICNITTDSPKMKSGVIIWDRFVKLFNMNMIDESSIIIIDESHKLFLDQSWREAAIFMRNAISKIKNHICYISATPVEEIDIDKTYRIEKNRNKVTVKHLKIIEDEGSWSSKSLILQAMLHIIYGNINYYDHIFVASDNFAQKLYDRLYGRYDCQLVRASQKDSPEYLELMKQQLIQHKILIGTCISYESLNFNNTNEKILTITDMDDKTTAHKITQVAGRVRFSYNNVYLIELVQKVIKHNYEKDAEYYNRLHNIKSKYNLYSKSHYVQKYYNEMEDVDNWYMENNNIDIIKNNLPMYIKWVDSEILASNISEKSPLNEQVKTYIVDYLKNNNDYLNNVDILIKDDCISSYMFFDQDKYIHIKEEGQSGYIIRENIREQQYHYHKLLTYIDYKKINNMIVNSRTMPKGVNREILKIIDILKLDKSVFDNYIFDLETYLKELNGTYYFALKKEIKEINNIRKTYSKCICQDEYTMYNNIYDMYVKKRISIYNKRIRCATKGGKKTKKIKDIATDIIYDSATKCANSIGKSLSYISKYKNRFVLVE